MEAKELRIGNLVRYRFGDNKWMQPHEISSYDIHVFGKEKEFKPIPLTEDWLLNFGFELIHSNEDGGSHAYHHSESDMTLDMSFQPMLFLDNQKDVENVHQLQNLYFALTGEELTIKE